MNIKLIKFQINGVIYYTIKSYTILQLCLLKNLEIPRFCYHEQLAIAGNCRMCLIEENKSIKPLVSCATNLLNSELKIYTNTKKIKKIRESIIEFLLINHPLDCPICDQGGECDLQDQTLIFGSDRGRFYESKRNTSNKNLGPLIKTSMNRCIHCTRCIRFTEETNPFNNLGITGKGSLLEIGNYINTVTDNELSGNIIDLCPVGALTSKPFSFSARPWELNSFETIDILDSFGSNIRIDTRGNTVLRILPRINSTLNENWISDKIRFIVDSFKKKRIKQPYLRINNLTTNYINISWKRAFFFIKKKILNSFYGNKQILNYNTIFFFILGDFVDAESTLLLKKLSNSLGGSNSLLLQNSKKEFFTKNKLISLDFRNNYLFNINIISPNNFHISILLNTNLRLEAPILNLKLKNLIKLKKLDFYYIGSNFNFSFFNKKLGNNIISLFKIVNGKHWLSNNFFNKKILFISNTQFFKENFFIKEKLNNLFFNKQIFHVFFNILPQSISSVGAYDIGLIENIHNHNLLKKKKFNNFFYLMENDNLTLIKQINCFYSKKKFIIYQGHTKNKFWNYINLFLPGKNFIEKSSIFFNSFGKMEKTNRIITTNSYAKTDWRILLNLLLYMKIKINIKNKQQLLNLGIDLSPFFKKLQKNFTAFELNFWKLNIEIFNNTVLKIILNYNYFKGSPLINNSITLNLISLIKKRKIIYNYNVI